jgi:hypothetical protein
VDLELPGSVERQAAGHGGGTGTMPAPGVGDQEEKRDCHGLPAY